MAAWSVLLVAWLTLHWAILPHIAQWRGAIENRAGAALGVPVRIGDIIVRSNGWVPSFELRDVTLLDAAGRPALKLPRVVAALSPRSLLSLSVRFEQVLVDGAELEVRRDAAGRIRVAGMDTGGARGSSGSSAADWLFGQREFVVRGGALRWVDDFRGAPPLSLNGVQVVVRNTLTGGHQIRIDATPPAGWGERFSLRGRFAQPLLAGRGDWRRWSGTAYAELPRADLGHLRRHVGLPFDLLRGDGALRAWIDVRDGRPHGATVDLALRAVSLQLAAAAPNGTTAAAAAATAAAALQPAAGRGPAPLVPITLRQVEGRLMVQMGHSSTPRPAGTAASVADPGGASWLAGDAGGSVSAQRFAFVTDDGIAWPRSDIALDWLPAAAGGGLTATRLDLRLLAQLTQRLPLNAAAQGLLAELRLDDVQSGVITGLAARWRGPLAAPAGYEVHGRIDGLDLAARPQPGPADSADNIGRPGLRNASGQWSATERGGDATLLIERGSLDVPGVFEQARVPLDRASASIGWRVAETSPTPGGKRGAEAPSFTLQIKQARFANADAAGELHGNWTRRGSAAPSPAGAWTADGGHRRASDRLGHLELDGRLTRGHAARVARYLPLVVPEGVRRYLGQAVRGGTLTRVSFRVRGDLAAFPFSQPGSGQDSEFRIDGRLDDATFAYVPGGPAAAADAAAPARTADTEPARAAAPGTGTGTSTGTSTARPVPAHRLPATAAAVAADPARPASWPALTALGGELIFDRAAMEIRNAKALLGGVALTGVHGNIAGLDHQPLLALDGGGSGALSDMLRFVGDSPVGGLLDHALAQATASGPAELRLALRIPLDDAAATAVHGSVTLLGNDVRLQPDALPLAAARGRVDFANAWVDGAGSTARRLDGPAGAANRRAVAVASGGAAVNGSGGSGGVADVFGNRPGGAPEGFDGAAGRPLNGFAVSSATARLLGGEVSFDGGSQPDGSVRFSGSGSVSAAAMRRSPELGPLARMAGSLSGQTRYAATMAWTRGRSELTVGSNLVGLAIDLPAPLRKAADAALPLHWQNVLLAADPARGARAAAARQDATAAGRDSGAGRLAAARDAGSRGPAAADSLRFELGDVVQARFVRDLGGPAPRVLRGGIGVYEAAPAPAAGVAAHLNLGQVDVDAWQAAAARLFGATASGIGAGAAISGGSAIAAPAGGSAGAAEPADAYAPTVIGLRAQQLVWSGKRYSAVVAGASLDDGTWRANLESDRLGGYLEYRAPRRAGGPAAVAPGGAGRVFARLSHLSLPNDEAGPVDRLLEAPTTSVPALDVTVDDLELGGKRLGRVEIDAVNRQEFGAAREAREWRLNRLTMTTPDARLVASGHWAALPAGPAAEAPNGGGPGAPGGARRRAMMDFNLELADGGALLERLGMGGAVRGGKGLMSGQLAWLGSPLDIDYPSLAGQVNVALDAGQFLKAEPGAARLLSVLSLRSLPRRLQLDFRDVLDQGFAFDSLTGDLTLRRGVAQTANLRMRGVQATVLMDGSADIGRETQNLRVVVVPEINAGAASLAYAAINPALGIGTFLAQLALRRPLMAAGTREFHITGDWDNPKVDRVERRPVEAVPNAPPDDRDDATR